MKRDDRPGQVEGKGKREAVGTTTTAHISLSAIRRAAKKRHALSSSGGRSRKSDGETRIEGRQVRAERSEDKRRQSGSSDKTQQSPLSLSLSTCIAVRCPLASKARVASLSACRV